MFDLQSSAPARDVYARAKVALFAALGLGLFGGGTAHAQALPTKPVGDPSRWEVQVGGGLVYGFALGGGESEQVNAIPWGSFTYDGGRLYGDGLDGVGYNLIHQPRFHAGVQIRPHYSGGGDREEFDRPKTGVDVAAYAYRRTWKDFIVGGRLTRDVSNVSDGTEIFASVNREDVTRVGLLKTMVYLRARDDESARAYYGVDDSQATAAIPLFHAESGLSNAGLAAVLAVPIGEKYAVGAFANYEWVVGDAADSPVVTDEGDFRAGVIVVRRFRGF